MTEEDLKKLEHGSSLLKLIQEAQEAKRSIEQFIEGQLPQKIGRVNKINIEINKTDNDLYLLKIIHDHGIGGDILIPKLDMAILITNIIDFLNEYIKTNKEIFDNI